MGDMMKGRDWLVAGKGTKTSVNTDGTMQCKSQTTTIVSKKPVLVEGTVITLEAGSWHDRLSLGVEGAASKGKGNPRNVVQLEFNGFGLVHIGADIGGNLTGSTDETEVESKDHLLTFAKTATGQRLQMRVVPTNASSNSQAGNGWLSWFKTMLWSNTSESLMLQFKVGEDGQNQWVDAAAFPTTVTEAPKGSNGLHIFVQLYKTKTKMGRLTAPITVSGQPDSLPPTKRPRDQGPDEEKTPPPKAQSVKSTPNKKSPKAKATKSSDPKSPKPPKAAKSPAKAKKEKKDSMESPKKRRKI